MCGAKVMCAHCFDDPDAMRRSGLKEITYKDQGAIICLNCTVQWDSSDGSADDAETDEAGETSEDDGECMSGEDVLGIGTRYRDCTASEVYENHQSYADWALSQDVTPGSQLARFVAYVKKRRRREGRAGGDGGASAANGGAFTCPVHGIPMNGPLTSRNGEPHNNGRQFYVCPLRGKDRNDCNMRGGFIWADGSEPFGWESMRRCAAYHGGAPPNLYGAMYGFY